MTLEADGFLSDGAPANAASVDAGLTPYSALAVKINQFVIGVMKVPQNTPQTVDELLPMVLAGRLVQDYEASVLLANRGFRAQARSMARSTLETALFCIGACREVVLKKGVKNGPTAFSDAFLSGHEQFRRKMTKELAELPLTTNDLKAHLRELHRELSEESLASAIDVKGLAEDIGLEDLYTVLYRPLSQDSHPSVTSVDHHFVVGETGGISGIRIGPDYEQYSDTVLSAIAAVLPGMDAYIAKYGGEEEKRELSAMVAAYKSLAEKT